MAKLLFVAMAQASTAARGPLFPVELEQSGAGWWLKTKVIHALPISSDDAGRRIEVRQDSGIHAVPVEKPLRLQFQEARDIPHALRRKRFRVPDAAAEGDDDDLIRAARGGFGIKPPGEDPVGDGEAGDAHCWRPDARSSTRSLTLY